MKKFILLLSALIMCVLLTFTAGAVTDRDENEEQYPRDAIVINPNDLWQVVVAISGGVVTLSGAGAVITGIVHKAKSPNKVQNERLDALESDMKKTNTRIENEVANINARLELGNKRFQADAEKTCSLESAVKETNKVIIEGLQALTAHAIDGNNIDRLKHSEEALNQYLRENLKTS